MVAETLREIDQITHHVHPVGMSMSRQRFRKTKCYGRRQQSEDEIRMISSRDIIYTIQQQML